LPADSAVLFLIRQIVHNALTFEMPWQRLAAAALFLATCFARARLGTIVLVIRASA
jgi:hypothetical protein